ALAARLRRSAFRRGGGAWPAGPPDRGASDRGGRAGGARRAPRGRARAAPCRQDARAQVAGAAGAPPREAPPAMSDLELCARFVEVALPVPLRRRFTYAVPEGMAAPAIGARVAVPFHGRKLAG